MLCIFLNTEFNRHFCHLNVLIMTCRKRVFSDVYYAWSWITYFQCLGLILYAIVSVYRIFPIATWGFVAMGVFMGGTSLYYSRTRPNMESQEQPEKKVEKDVNKSSPSASDSESTTRKRRSAKKEQSDWVLISICDFQFFHIDQATFTLTIGNCTYFLKIWLLYVNLFKRPKHDWYFFRHDVVCVHCLIWSKLYRVLIKCCNKHSVGSKFFLIFFFTKTLLFKNPNITVAFITFRRYCVAISVNVNSKQTPDI